MLFIDAFAGWPGSCHDGRVLRNFPIFEKVSDTCDRHFPGNSNILGDSAYPLKKWLLTPFKTTGNLTQPQRRHNYKHSATRSIVERPFALLKGR